SHDVGNLVVLVTLDVVQHKHGFVTGRQLPDGSFKVDPVHSAAESQVRRSNIFPGPPVSSSGSVVSSRDAAGSDFVRKRIRTTLTVMRCSQVEKADSPRKVPILRKSCRKASCMRSSASDGLLTIRRHRAYTRRPWS